MTAAVLSCDAVLVHISNPRVDLDIWNYNVQPSPVGIRLTDTHQTLHFKLSSLTLSYLKLSCIMLQFWFASLIPEWLWLWGATRLNQALRRQADKRIRHRSGGHSSRQGSFSQIPRSRSGTGNLAESQMPRSRSGTGSMQDLARQRLLSGSGEGPQ